MIEQILINLATMIVGVCFGTYLGAKIMKHELTKEVSQYKYVYERPKIWFWSETLQLTMKFANMMLAPIRPVRPRPQEDHQ